MTAGILLFTGATLVVGQIPIIASTDFPQDLQESAVTATVQVRNLANKMVGSGVLIAREGPFAYILTARHLVDGADGLEISVFLKDSYPKPKAVHRTLKIVAESPPPVDLALLRLDAQDRLPGPVALCPVGKVPAGGFMGFAVGCDVGYEPIGWIEKIPQKKRAQLSTGTETIFFWEVDRKPIAGRSGGPLIDKRGYLLGVCSGANRDKSYFTHIDEIHRFLKMKGYRRFLEGKDG
jgi:S1-C subfamily serine protease